MPAREAMPEAPAMRYHDFGLLVTLAGPMAEQCLWDGIDSMKRLALHEAAHSVAAWRLGRVIAAVVIRSDGTGQTTLVPRGVETSDAPNGRRELSDGRMAVAIAWTLRADRKAARELLRVRRHEARLHAHADGDFIQAVADRLLDVGSLTGLEVEHVIHETLRARWARKLEPKKKENERNVFE